jgi:hypothetical protein
VEAEVGVMPGAERFVAKRYFTSEGFNAGDGSATQAIGLPGSSPSRRGLFNSVTEA